MVAIPIYFIGLTKDQLNLLKANSVSEKINKNIPGIQKKYAIGLASLDETIFTAIRAAAAMSIMYNNIGKINTPKAAASML